MKVYHTQEKHHDDMDNSLQTVISLANLLKGWIKNPDSFLSLVNNRASYSDKIEETINELKEAVDDVDLAFTAISLIAHKKRKAS